MPPYYKYTNIGVHLHPIATFGEFHIFPAIFRRKLRFFAIFFTHIVFFSQCFDEICGYLLWSLYKIRVFFCNLLTKFVFISRSFDKLAFFSDPLTKFGFFLLTIVNGFFWRLFVEIFNIFPWYFLCLLTE